MKLEERFLLFKKVSVSQGKYKLKKFVLILGTALRKSKETILFIQSFQ